MDKRVYALLRRLVVLLFCTGVLMTAPGCFKEVVETREPLPDIIWPKPPEVPRIRFVNSISRPRDMNIYEGLSVKLFKFFKGDIMTSIVTPYGIMTDDEERLFVVDTFLRQVHVFDGKNNDHFMFPDRKTSFVSPIGITRDRSGNIYVSDSMEGVVKVFTSEGKKYVKELGKGLLSRPTGLVFNEKTNEVLVVDTKNCEIIRYDADTHQVKGTIGREGTSQGYFYNPTNIFTTPEGLIYVTDSLNFRVQILDPKGKFLSSFGQAGDSPGFFGRPKGVAVDSDGNIYVVDALFDTVQIFDPRGKLLMDFGGPGYDYGQFWLPSAIFIDEHDRIYVADSYNKRVQVFQYMKGEEFIRP